MSALESLTGASFTATPPPASSLDTLTKAPAPVATLAPKAQGSLGSLTKTPFVAPPQPKAPTGQAPFFQAKDDSTGAFMGISDQKDISGKPYFAYRLPNEGTTTDRTRVATTFDPRQAQPLTMNQLHNGRMPSNVSAPIKGALGGNYSDELDHTIALELSGSNSPDNLRIEPGRGGVEGSAPGESANFDKRENELAQKVIRGEMSLFDAQHQLATEKNQAGDKNPIPWVDKPTAEASHEVQTAPDNTALGFLKNLVQGAIGVAEHPINNGLYKALPGIKDIVHGVKTGDWKPYVSALNDYVSMPPTFITDPNTGKQVVNPDWEHKMTFVIGGFVGGGDAQNIGREIIDGIKGKAVSGSGKPEPKTDAVATQKYPTIHEGGVVKMVDGEPVKIVDGVDTFVHKGDGGYIVSEASTGRFISESSSKEGAISKAGFNIDHVGKEKFLEMIKQNKLPGTSPKPIPKELAPLAEEAKKYGSAEEFVKSQGTPVYHGGGSFDKTKFDSKIGFSVSPLKDTASEYAGQKKTPVQEIYVSPKAKIANLNDIPKSVRDGFHGDSDIAKYLKEKGFDGFRIDNEIKEIRILNPDVLRTKSQLTDLYEQATSNSDLPARASEGRKPQEQSPQSRPTESGPLPENPKERPQGQPEVLPAESARTDAPNSGESKYPSTSSSFRTSITENNGGVEPPVNKGGLQAPEIDWTRGKDLAAIRLSTDTMERNLEKIFPRETADKINGWLVDKVRDNETNRVSFLNDIRSKVKADIVDGLGIRPGSKESVFTQRYGEGRISLDELKQAAPAKWENIKAASERIKQVYEDLLKRWNKERVAHGMKPVARRENYFRHFLEIGEFQKLFGFNLPDGNLPTAISGITEFFRSQTPWASAAMRRFNGMFTEDAVGGLDNYLDTTSRAIFHTDSVQRGRLLEKYLRQAATGRPGDVNLPNFASNLNDWTNLVSGKQARLDRAVESVVGRPALAVLRNLTKRFGMNVIGGNISAAVTHTIPFVYTLATVGTRGAVMGLMDTLRAPFLADFSQIGGVTSKFLTRRFGITEIERTTGEKIGATISAPFKWADEFISRFAVASKFTEGIHNGLSEKEAMAQADNYANRVIGDRSIGNLPNLMNTKTLGMITQFQIEVNDNLHVLAHDIPRWAKGDVRKVGTMFVKFAVYSYLFNQFMQNIKGSGKGLDPIDLGLTLAGLNEESQGQSFSQRLGLFGSDLAKELPFASIPTGGQIPAFQPLQQGITAAMGGDLKGFASNMATAYLSPVGGGMQAKKTYKGIEAYLRGYATDTGGKITGFVPKTPGNLLKGVLFGPSAYPEVKKSRDEIKILNTLMKGQQSSSKEKNAQATTLAQQLMDLSQSDGPEAAAKQFDELSAKDADMAKRVATAVKNIKEGITKEDTMIKSLGVSNGTRAQFLKSKIDGMKTPEEKNAYWNELVAKHLVNNKVLSQIEAMR